MRRRLLAALTVFATLAVLAFAVPLSLTYATSRTQELVLGRSGDADRFATLADAAAAAGDGTALAEEATRYHELYGENVLVVDARGASAVNAGVDVADPEVAAAVAAARRNQRPHPVTRLLPWSADTMLVTRPVGTGVQVNGAVVIEASTGRARADITRAWVIIGLGAAAAMVLFTLLALTLSRWVLRPLAALSDAVAGLTASLPKPRAAAAPASITRRYGGPPEMRAVAESFDSMAAAVSESAEAQRQLVADTAHAMRNPLAALTIRLDSLEPSIPPAASDTFRRASGEVDRLTSLLDGLLSLAVAETPEAFTTDASENHCDAVQVVADRIDAWHSAFVAAGQTLRAEPAVGAAEVAVSADVLAQILDVPLSNATRYSGAGATVSVSVDLADDRVLLTVADDGPGVPAAELDKLTTRFFRGSTASSGGSGLGLPIAAALAKSRGGALTVRAVEPHGLATVVDLPWAEVPR
ncbi:HAMP domain-containing histidine kinase [Nocardia puris]|uniref:sensor histidine kinase n=1 Tax=Nocardia puris TaxID=208602 RepID=UPI0018946EF7|nr:HAMP domain-containing sensor histidine kinase [Nocardia puris]MBF6212524.1 HAMP domain-containing histidine kinase [Nocardia puris]MBF6366771.1 HAMP domain-containing histidine kinase [Nocardia puris]MBF6461113.1 HAMP domain-containing histidine kinase [Nocardia puris]